MNRLSKEQKIELMDQIKEGKSDDELSILFDVSKSNIQYHRTQMRRKGLLGIRKRGPKKSTFQKEGVKSTNNKSRHTQSIAKNEETFKLRVNGVSISIGNSIKDVKINKNEISISL